MNILHHYPLSMIVPKRTFSLMKLNVNNLFPPAFRSYPNQYLPKPPNLPYLNSNYQKYSPSNQQNSRHMYIILPHLFD